MKVRGSSPGSAILTTLAATSAVESVDPQATTAIALGNISFFPETRLLSAPSGEILKLRKKEADLLIFLLANQCRTITKQSLLELIWNYESFASTNTLEVHLCLLRRKLTKLFNFNPIRTIHGIGYYFALNSDCKVI